MCFNCRSTPQWDRLSIHGFNSTIILSSSYAWTSNLCFLWTTQTRYTIVLQYSNTILYYSKVTGSALAAFPMPHAMLVTNILVFLTCNSRANVPTSLTVQDAHRHYFSLLGNPHGPANGGGCDVGTVTVTVLRNWVIFNKVIPEPTQHLLQFCHFATLCCSLNGFLEWW